MVKTYIQFDALQSGTKNKKESLIKRSIKNVVVNLLTKVIPLANPDFEDKIDNVKYWLVECDLESGVPQREIGLDQKDQVIMKMPFKTITDIGLIITCY